MIRLAKYKEIGEILNLTRACAKAMIAQGIYQWNEHYPTKAAFQLDLEREELYVLEKSSKIVGIIVISAHMDQEYIPIKWLTPNTNNGYIHRLAVHPNYQSQGYAQALMDFAEAKAQESKMDSVRLDTFSQNKRNQLFYQKRGYTQLGNVYFPKQSEHPFYCYELVLNPNASPCL